VETMRFDKGFISAHFVTDPERMEVSYDDPYVLLVEGKLSRVGGNAPAARESGVREKPGVETVHVFRHTKEVSGVHSPSHGTIGWGPSAEGLADAVSPRRVGPVTSPAA
jgi:hypothetical protein